MRQLHYFNVISASFLTICYRQYINFDSEAIECWQYRNLKEQSPVVQAIQAEAATTLNKFEKFKAQKDGLAVKDELEYFAQIGWEAMAGRHLPFL
jgi:hypothetical protein